MYAYVLNKKEEVGFCVCLTCKKGIMEDGFTSQGTKWVSTHANKSDCKKAHKQLLAEFKQKIGSIIPPPTVIVQAPISNSVSALWDKLKIMPQLSPFMKDIETACQEYYEFDSENEGSFVFDAAEGFERTVRSSIGDRKEILKFNDIKVQMEDSHESTLIEMRDKIRTLTMQVNNLLADNKQLNQRVSILERENGRYKAAYPPLSEDPQ
jgi:hypothetical protein